MPMSVMHQYGTRVYATDKTAGNPEAKIAGLPVQIGVFESGIAPGIPWHQYLVTLEKDALKYHAFLFGKNVSMDFPKGTSHQAMKKKMHKTWGICPWQFQYDDARITAVGTLYEFAEGRAKTIEQLLKGIVGEVIAGGKAQLSGTPILSLSCWYDTESQADGSLANKKLAVLPPTVELLRKIAPAIAQAYRAETPDLVSIVAREWYVDGPKHDHELWRA